MIPLEWLCYGALVLVAVLALLWLYSLVNAKRPAKETWLDGSDKKDEET